MAMLNESDYIEPPVISPVSGALINIEDNDHCLQAYEEAEQLKREIRAFQAKLRDSLWSRTVKSGESKTRHIQGRRYLATIVEQDKDPNSAVLGQIAKHFPEASKLVVVPDGYRIAKTQWKKMQATASQCDDFNAVKNMVIEAINSGTTPSPRVTKITPIL